MSGWGKGGVTIRAETLTSKCARLHPHLVSDPCVCSLLSEDVLTTQGSLYPHLSSGFRPGPAALPLKDRRRSGSRVTGQRWELLLTSPFLPEQSPQPRAGLGKETHTDWSPETPGPRFAGLQFISKALSCPEVPGFSSAPAMSWVLREEDAGRPLQACPGTDPRGAKGSPERGASLLAQMRAPRTGQPPPLLGAQPCC